MKKIFVFPNKQQVEIIVSKNSNDLLIFQKQGNKKVNDNKLFNNIIEISNNFEIENFSDDLSEYIFIPCNEEAVYFLKNLARLYKLNLPFNDKCFDMIYKINIENILNDYDFKTIKKSTVPMKYPFIVKPNFGFGSIGVQKIQNKDELINYQNDFDKLVKVSDINNFENKYFKNDKNFIVYEEDKTHCRFFSVPFIYLKERNFVLSFPIEGKDKFNDFKLSSFYWSKFEFNPNGLDEKLRYKINKTIKMVSEKFCKQSLTGIVELVFDELDDEVKIIEFSPRVAGGKMIDLINYSTNINLNQVLVNLFTENSSDYFEDLINKKLIEYKPMNLILTKDLPLENYTFTSSNFSMVFERELFYNFIYMN